MSGVLSFRIPYQHFRTGFGRMALSVLAVALGVALVVAIQLMNTAVLQAFIETMDGLVGRAALTVTSGDGLPFDETLVDRIRSVKGVTVAAPLVSAIVFPNEGAPELLTVHGVDVTDDAAVRIYHRGDTAKVVDDTEAFVNARNAIVIGREFAARRGLVVGDTIDFVTPTGVRPFKIYGTLEPEGLARTLEGRLVVMDLPAAQLAFTAPGMVNQIDIRVQNGSEDTVKSAIEALLPAGVVVRQSALRKAVVRDTVAALQTMLTVFALLAIIASVVICYSRLGTIFGARLWEIGLLRAVGLRRSMVFVELLKESLLLGLAGSVLGLPLGIIIGRHALPIVTTSTAMQLHLPVSLSEPVVTAGVVVWGVVIGLGAAVLAATVPALRLARKQPVAALSLRGLDAPLRGEARWRLGALFAVSTVALVLLQLRTPNATLGLFTTVLMAVACCTLARPLVQSCGRWLQKPWHRLFGASGQVAAAHMLHGAQRVSLTVAALGVGLAVVLMLGILAGSFERSLIAQLTRRVRAELILTSAFVSGGYVGAPLHGDLADRVRAVPGVRAVAGWQRIDIPAEGGTVTLDSYDAACFRDVRLCDWALEPGSLPDALESVVRGDAAIVSMSFARRSGRGPGDSIELQSPRGPQRFTIAGVTRTEIASAVIIDRTSYRPRWNDPTVAWLLVAVGEGRTDEVAARLAADLGPTNRVQIQSNAQFLHVFQEVVRQAFAPQYLMEIVIFLLVVIGLGDALVAAVLERMREIGMMRAVGIRRSTVFAVILLESLSAGVLGLLLAGVTGLALGAFWVRTQFPAILGWGLDLYVPVQFALAASLLTMALCALASMLPAMRAARLSIPVALRTE